MRCAAAFLAIMAAAVCPAAPDPGFANLPFGCSVLSTDPVADAQREAVARKLGVPLRALSNTRLAVQGATVQVNVLEAENGDDAKRLHAAIARAKPHPAFCRLHGTRVFEFCKAGADTAIKAAYEMGLVAKPDRVVYRVEAPIATARTADYMAFNELCGVFFAADGRDGDAASAARVRELSKGFTFGDSLALRTPPGADVRFTPAPVGVATQGAGRVVFTFASPPRRFDVPFVTLRADIACDRSGLTPSDRKPDAALLAATPHWPVGDPGVAALARRITAGRTTDDAKVRAILEWLEPNRNIRSAGPAGSRWGVKKVLDQKFGHCWDSSDCFVTLARAAGVPCRQVGGWLFGTGGHIWAEVLVPGKGWQQVDPTGGGRLECGIYHVAYFASEDGDMPILYTALPKLELVEAP